MRFHVPGHKGGPGADPGLLAAVGERALALDICQDIEGIDVGPSRPPYEHAEQLAATAYGAGRTWFLTNGATQGNHALCLALAKPGKHVLVQRNSHASIVDGLVLSGGMASFVSPEYDEELGMAHGVTPEALEAALARSPDIDAAFVVSPTYYGMAADIRGCAEVAHAAGVALVVDCAWGSHFGFHPRLPAVAAQRGADAMLASTHKIVGSMTQSAMLHVARTACSTPTRSRAVCGWCAPPAPTRCCLPRWTRAAPASCPRRGAARPHDGGLRPRPGGDQSIPAARWWAGTWWAAPGSPAGIRCGS